MVRGYVTALTYAVLTSRQGYACLSVRICGNRNGRIGVCVVGYVGGFRRAVGR
eukprot:TRINITY_DN1_c377_g1_i1.p1 TRINITY_DN1_c377_g1~~TRINITY_DN1_c377_g1_i1.p1  ORF type:complete len:53 (+),score=1.20 TRINITY_DN1_c377_g1_i1:132-290(+)